VMLTFSLSILVPSWFDKAYEALVLKAKLNFNLMELYSSNERPRNRCKNIFWKKT
jgi:hypothetical protein